jgi:hypothetical protein
VSGESNHIDEIIRRKFENFEPAPPPETWGKIQKALDPASGTGSSGPVVFTVLTLLSLIITLFFIVTNLTDIPVANPGSGQNSSSDISWSEPLIDNYSDIGNTYSDAIPAAGNNPVYDFGNHQPSTGPVSNEIYENPPVTSQTMIRKDRKADKARAFERFGDQDTKSTFKREDRYEIDGPAMLVGAQVSGTQDNIFNPDSRKQARWSGYDYRRKKDHYFTVGFDFIPEITNYSNDQLKITGQSYMIGLTYGFSNVYIKSGIGLRNARDKGEYSIQYNKYLGNYEHVYEVTFDSTDQGVVPTYHTFTVDVYDSIDHVIAGEQTINNRYLEIPLLFGYKKDLGKLSIHVHGGPNVSILTSKDSRPSNYPEEQIRIIDSQQDIETRMKVSWQLMVGAGIDYELTDRLNLTMEPVFRYYVSPEFNTGNKGSAFGFGFRTGISYTISK